MVGSLEIDLLDGSLTREDIVDFLAYETASYDVDTCNEMQQYLHIRAALTTLVLDAVLERKKYLQEHAD